MYGDTSVIRQRSGQLREQGQDLRAVADQLVGQAEAVSWPGRAGEQMRERIRERAVHLRAVANAHETAADTLRDHGRTCENLLEEISNAERRARRDLEDGDPDVRASFTPPPAGHKDWLTVEIPRETP